jgi:hypothetical protein
MSKFASFPTSLAEPPAAPTDPVVGKTLDLVKTLIESLPPAAKEQLLCELAVSQRSAIAPRAGEVLGTVLRFISNRKDFTITELRQRIEAQHLGASSKAIYNAIGYLTRKQHIRRIGYGRYIIDGLPFVTADELGGQPSITEQDLDD